MQNKINDLLNKIGLGKHKKFITILTICVSVVLIFVLAGVINSISNIKNSSDKVLQDSTTDGINIGASTESISPNFGFDSGSKSENSSTIYEESEDNLEYTDEKSDKNVENESVDSYGDTVIINEKLVYTCDMSIETKKYIESYDKITKLIHQYNGVIQEERTTDNDYNWYYSDNSDEGTVITYINCRIPSDKYNEFIGELENLGENNKITSKSTSTDNITQNYVDSKAELEALKVQEESLMNMLKSANTISDMITVEDRLTDVRSRINSLTTEIRRMDMDVAYSYVNITLEEVEEYSKEEELGFFSYIWKGFKGSFETALDILKETVAFVITMIPIVVINIIPAIIIIRLVVKLFKKHSKKKKSPEVE